MKQIKQLTIENKQFSYSRNNEENDDKRKDERMKKPNRFSERKT